MKSVTKMATGSKNVSEKKDFHLTWGGIICLGPTYLLQRGEHCTKEHTRQARLLLACRSILCQLFAQDWHNLHWGRFKNVEVDSLILNKLRYHSIYEWPLTKYM